jgi:hypothetical protein
MKRLATWLFYAIGAIAAGYLSLYVYAWLNAPNPHARRSDPDLPQPRCAEI